MKQGKGREATDKIIDELVKYADYHFSTEENLMSKYGYPEFRGTNQNMMPLSKLLGNSLIEKKDGKFYTLIYPDF